MKPSHFPLSSLRCRWRVVGAATAMSVAVALSGCAAVPPSPAPASGPQPVAPVASAPAGADPRAGGDVAAPSVLAPAPATMAGDAPAPSPVRANPKPHTTAPDPTAELVRYFYQIRLLSSQQLAAEIDRFDATTMADDDRLRLALALVQTLQLAETQRALSLIQEVLEAPDERSLAIKPLAHLLGHLLREQRRLDLQNDRLSQQLRENQRRVEQLNDRIEAMRAIERSLNRPAPRTAPNR